MGKFETVLLRSTLALTVLGGVACGNHESSDERRITQQQLQVWRQTLTERDESFKAFQARLTAECLAEVEPFLFGKERAEVSDELAIRLTGDACPAEAVPSSRSLYNSALEALDSVKNLEARLND